MQAKVRYEYLKARKFPWIGINGELVVLFTDYDEGIVLHDDNDYEKGELRDDWQIDSFTEFNGLITLSND